MYFCNVEKAVVFTKAELKKDIKYQSIIYYK